MKHTPRTKATPLGTKATPLCAHVHISEHTDILNTCSGHNIAQKAHTHINLLLRAKHTADSIIQESKNSFVSKPVRDREAERERERERQTVVER